MLGKGVVGKTSLIYRFVNNKVLEGHDPTIEDNYKAMGLIDGEDTEIHILDTAGEEDYQNMLDQWIEAADGFVFVFSITDLETLDALKPKFARILKHTEKKFPITLVGNKCDLEENRQVPKEKAEEYAKEIKAKYYETSALTDCNNNCKEPFLNCAKEILNMKKKQEIKELKEDDDDDDGGKEGKKKKAGGCIRCTIY